MTLYYCPGGQPVHHGKLKLCHPIFASSVSKDYVFTIVGLMPEGPDEIYYLRRLTSLVYSFRETGWTLSGIERVMEER